MKTTQTVNVSLNSTHRVSILEWSNKARFEVYESVTDSVEIQDIDTDELLQAVYYFLRNLSLRDDKSADQTRRLNDIKDELVSALKVASEEVTSEA